MLFLLFHEEAHPLMAGWRLKFTTWRIEPSQTVKESKHTIASDFQQKKFSIKNSGDRKIMEPKLPS